MILGSMTAAAGVPSTRDQQSLLYTRTAIASGGRRASGACGKCHEVQDWVCLEQYYQASAVWHVILLMAWGTLQSLPA